MEKELSFDAFWDLSIKLSQQRNTLKHHPCCDSWSTRKSKHSNLGHSKSVHWGKFMMAVDRKITDKKQAVKVRMEELNMRIPVHLNKVCDHQKTQTHNQLSHQEIDNNEILNDDISPQLSRPHLNTTGLTFIPEIDKGISYTND